MTFGWCAVALLASAAWSTNDGVLPAQPVSLLPGMRAKPAATSEASLPAPIISDLTNAPNPFDSRLGGLAGQTEISYALTGNYVVSINLYDLLGQRVRSWGFRPGENGGRSGNNTVLWDGTNETGRKVSKGGYIAEIQIETPQTDVTAIRKIGVIH